MTRWVIGFVLADVAWALGCQVIGIHEVLLNLVAGAAYVTLMPLPSRRKGR